MSGAYSITEIRTAEEIPDRAALERMLTVYMGGMLEMFAARGGPRIAPGDVLGAIWDDLPDYLPPDGRLFLARDRDGELVGCSFLRKIRSDAGEMKRLYVDPRMRGSGLGSELIRLRMEAAREMGWTTLLADTVRGNTKMLNLYEKSGFREIPRYPENANPADMAPWLVYLQCDLGEEPA